MTTTNKLADALDCFWNAALDGVRRHDDATANAVMNGMVQGFAAVAARLREHDAQPAPAPVHPCTMGVDCEEAGVCYASANGQPEQCGAHPPAPAADGAGELPPIERDEAYDRDYIPLPGGWEVQTKGSGSTFRICDTKSGERMPVVETMLHPWLERMAREVHAAIAALRQPVPGKYDNVLRPFFRLMERELHANAGKGDRPGWLAMSPAAAMLEIYYHAAKLQKAVKNGEGDAISEYAADVANMAMMMVDICGGLELESALASQLESRNAD